MRIQLIGLLLICCLSSAYSTTTYKTLADSTWTANPNKSYKWNPTVDLTRPTTIEDCAPYNGNCQGAFAKVSAETCPPAWDKSSLDDYGTTTGQSTFLQPQEGYAPGFAYQFSAGFIEKGFGRWEALGHGLYCPTVDPAFWFNQATDSFIFYNFVNNQWNFGKGSVDWWFTAEGNVGFTACPAWEFYLVGETAYRRVGDRATVFNAQTSAWNIVELATVEALDISPITTPGDVGPWQLTDKGASKKTDAVTTEVFFPWCCSCA